MSLRLPWRRRGVSASHIAYVAGYSFPGVLRDKLREEYPELTDAQGSAVLEGLRAWFMVALHAEGATTEMPSRIVDVAWHAFIVLTRQYAEFCQEGLGRFLQHAPIELLESPTPDGLAQTLRVAESLPPHLFSTPAGAMVLFTIDEELGIEDGYAYPESYLDDLRRRRGPVADDGDGGFLWGSDGDGDGGGGGGD